MTRRVGAWGLCLALGGALGVSGCSALHANRIPKVPLASLPLTTIKVEMPNGGTLAPGKKGQLVVTLTDSAGKVYSTNGKGEGKANWAELHLEATVVKVNAKGSVQMPKLPWESDGKVGHVTVTVPGLPELKGEADVTPRYDVEYHANFSGTSGTNGMDGTNGLSGSDGSMGSIDPQHPSAGGNGSDGSNGTDGSNGGDGWSGPEVLVQVALWPGNHALLEVEVSAGKSHVESYLIDPVGGSVTVRSLGGSGGKGGSGGHGGRGGSGGVGSPNGMSGHDGLNGSDGRNGSDGSDGQVTLVYDPKAAPYIAAIHVPRNAVIHEQPVNPLW